MAQNSFDYYGIYRADFAGSPLVQVEFVPDNRYSLITIRGDRKTGEFLWDETGRIVTLSGSATPDFTFFVGENVFWLYASKAYERLRFIKGGF